MNRGLCFLLGAAVGAVAAYFVTKAHYEQEFEFEEFDPEEYRERKEREQDQEESAEPIREDYINPRKLSESNLNKPSIMEYAERIRKEGYKDYTASGTKKLEKSVEEAKEVMEERGKKLIEYISPEDFGEDDNYNTTCWIYTSDGVLMDDANDEVNDVDISNTVGSDFADHFGEFEPDAVHVRNDDIEMYFEILRDERTFEQIRQTLPDKPHKEE